ncbi:TetR/AcrR family transcriptional regulator [Aeromicrobium terrae]|uniref:TetR/AcrR family transcriptional regulator n=1 Tax=Aeromicrobium terrae TaxID=2498846 RepID=A0A5C8NM16_9ACTN|nr:TetR/AcrR family transcriptional regulator [Aeromicrobium terrae]TXL62759.1 TetR/AcrR family transcriptional regulator [Aeromicrobium terrae]
MTDAVVERILDAAERLFASEGPRGVGMAAIAEAAGCSRATLYRYFENRRELQTAFASREAGRIVDDVLARSGDVVETILGALAEVRSRPSLAAWISPDASAELLDVLRHSPLVEATIDPADTDLARWTLRSLVSLLAFPPDDAAEEERLVRRFVAPLLAG